MRILIEDTTFAPASVVKLSGIIWMEGVAPRDLWLRLTYSATDTFTIWACGTRDAAIAMPQPTEFLASAVGYASASPRSILLSTPVDSSYCAIMGLYPVVPELELPDILWAYVEDSLSWPIIDKATAILKSYAYPMGSLAGVNPVDITIGPGSDRIASLPAIELLALGPIDALALHDMELQTRKFEVSVRTPGPLASAWRSAINYSRNIISILADEHRRDVPGGILCRYVSGEGPVPDGPSEGGQKCTMTFEVVGIECRPEQEA